MFSPIFPSETPMTTSSPKWLTPTGFLLPSRNPPPNSLLVTSALAQEGLPPAFAPAVLSASNAIPPTSARCHALALRLINPWSLCPYSEASCLGCLGFQGCLETPTRYMPAWALAGWLAHWFALTCPQLKTLPRIPTPLKIKSRLFPWAPANLPRWSWPSLPSSLTQPRLQPHQVDREAEEATRSEQNRMIQPGAGTFERGV